jgi:hypothetical protein
VASRLVMDSLAELAPTLGGIASAPDLHEEERATDRLTTMAEQAHASILTHAAQHPPLYGMGTTLVTPVVKSGRHEVQPHAADC